ncbi:hypothetical protein T12_2959 [Trichinella patagoniensis]|uniref:Uncharacterized protein n=1 Tax=Trichinella patagoniensis TaxID=990121 RepID=A0A0V0ZYE2_9BILA|nr:hypothetical protein T12_2959 [Trichinella patagoniensis]
MIARKKLLNFFNDILVELRFLGSRVVKFSPIFRSFSVLYSVCIGRRCVIIACEECASESGSRTANQFGQAASRLFV